MSVFADLFGANWAVSGQQAASDRDAATMLAQNGKFQASQKAQLWGKVIPITYGVRRITGQLLQVGKYEQKSTFRYVTSYQESGNVSNVSAQGTGTDLTQNLTFAHVFGEPGNPTSKQLLMRLWINGTLVYDAQTGERQPGLKFAFFEGTELQEPDVMLNDERYDYPVPYRGLMYITFYDYVISDAQNIIQTPGHQFFAPMVEAEFWELTANPIVENKNVDANGVQPANLYGSSGGFDARRGLYYVPDADGNIWTFDVALGEYVNSVKITGWPTGLANNYHYIGGGTPAHFFMEFGTPYFLSSVGGSNSRMYVLVNAETGVITSHVGVDSSSLGPSLTNLGAALSANTRQTAEGTEIIYFNIFGYPFRMTASQGQLQVHSFGADFGNIPTISESYPVYIAGVGWKITFQNKLMEFDAVTAYYTGTYPIKAVFQSSVFPDLVIFEQDNVTADWRVYRTTRDGSKIFWEYNNVTHPTMRFSSIVAQAWRTQSFTNQQFIAWTDGTTTYRLDMLSGAVETITNRQPVTISSSTIYDDYSRQFITSGAEYPIYNSETGRITLESFLRDLARRQGYANGDVSVVGIPDTIVGAAITQISDINTILADIAVAYRFEIVRRGKKIIFTRRPFGSIFSPDGTLTRDDMAILTKDEEAYVQVKSSRADGDQVPGKIRINFIDPDYKFVVNTVEHARNDATADLSAERVLNLPIVMTASEAATLAARAIITSVEARLQHEFLLPQKWQKIEPGDYYRIQLDGYVDTTRIENVSYNADHTLSIKAGAITTTTGPAVVMNDYVAPIVTPNEQGAFAATVPLLLSIPLMVPSDQQSGNILETYATLLPADRGSSAIGSIVKSNAGAADFPINIGSLTQTAVIGRVINDASLLNGVQPNIYEVDRTLVIRISQGDASVLSAASYVDVLAGANRAVIGAYGRWEIIGYTGVSFNPANRALTLTGVVRGLRGTEIHSNSHTGNDYFVAWQTGSRVLDITTVATQLDDTVYYASRNLAGQVNLQDARGAQVAGEARKPWAPGVTLAAAGNDIVIAWNRRTRLSGPFLNGSSSVPLDEASERYSVDIYRAGNLVRTIDGLTAATYTYTQAEQLADGFTGVQSELTLAVYQLSALVGRGFGEVKNRYVE